MQTQVELDNGIFKVDLKLYHQSEEYQEQCGKVFNNLVVWLVEYDNTGNPVSYGSSKYIDLVSTWLEQGMVIATKQEYEKVESILDAIDDKKYASQQPTEKDRADWDKALRITFGDY